MLPSFSLPPLEFCLGTRSQSSRAAHQSGAGHRSGAPQRADRLSAPRRTRIARANTVGMALAVQHRRTSQHTQSSKTASTFAYSEAITGENLRPVDGVQQSIAPHQFSNTHVW